MSKITLTVGSILAILSVSLAHAEKVPPNPAPKTAPREAAPAPRDNLYVPSLPECITREVVDRTAVKEGRKVFWLTDSHAVMFFRAVVFLAASESDPMAALMGREAPPPTTFPPFDSIAVVFEKDDTHPVEMLFEQDVACNAHPISDEQYHHLVMIGEKFK